MLVDQATHFGELGHQIGYFGERAHSLVHALFLLHPRRILQKIARGVPSQPFPGADPPQREVHIGTARRVAQDLVAQRDGVVEQAGVRVMLDGALVVRDRIGDAALTECEVADLVQQRNVNILARQFALLDGSHVRGNRAIDLSQLLELSRLLPVLRGVRHAFEIDSE